ncbi:Tethering factor for nuclear proteasome sts1, partial [Dinochytrium kinnereticum]
MASPQVLAASPNRQSSGFSKKRKNDSDDVVMSHFSGSPESPHRFATPIKRVKMFTMDSPSPPSSSEPHTSSPHKLPVARLLETLGKEELLSMLATLMNQHPALEGSVAALLPRPTLSSATTHLQQLMKNLEGAFPYNRWGPDRSDYAFNRVRNQLSDLLETLQHYLTHFTEPSMYPDSLSHDYPSNAFTFLRYSAQIASSLPVWSSDHHNSVCRDMAFARISKAWILATGEIHRRMRDEGRMYPASLIAEWARDLTAESTKLKGAFGFADASQEFSSKLGWVIGLNSGPSFSDGAASP